MRFQEQRLAYELERRRQMPAENTRSADLPVIVFAACIGFAVLFGMMVYIFSASQ
jgi:hypothetical protein